MSGPKRKSPPVAATTEGPSDAVGASAITVYFRGTDKSKPFVFCGDGGREWRFKGKRGRILKMLAARSHGLTQYDTYPWCTRLASHITVLREAGLSIRTVREGRCRQGRYYLETPAAASVKVQQ